MSLTLIAHFGFGLSREEVRGAAIVAAAVIGALVAADFFGKQLRNRQ
jgi:hypothetical protein